VDEATNPWSCRADRDSSRYLLPRILILTEHLSAPSAPLTDEMVCSSIILLRQVHIINIQCKIRFRMGNEQIQRCDLTQVHQPRCGGGSDIDKRDADGDVFT